MREADRRGKTPLSGWWWCLGGDLRTLAKSTQRQQCGGGHRRGGRRGYHECWRRMGAEFPPRSTHLFSTYDNQGVRLAYPENWTLEEGQDDDSTLQLSISSPNTAFWTLSVYDHGPEPESLVEQALEALRGEYPDLETSPVEEVQGDYLLIGCDVNFICLDLTNTIKLRAFERDGETLLMLAQSEDRELQTVSATFDAILQSLLVGLPEGA